MFRVRRKLWSKVPLPRAAKSSWRSLGTGATTSHFSHNITSAEGPSHDPTSNHGFTFFTNWARLIRFKSPVGTYLLLIPCYLGMASGVTTSMIGLGADWVSVGAPLLPPQLALWFALGAFTMRSAGCIVNDMLDREIDRSVERTANRPLACGDLSMRQASLILSGHLALGLIVVSALHPYSVALAFGVVPFAAAYPLAKRYTFYPQVVLGMVFNWGVFVGHAALAGSVNWSVCIPLYVACVIWTVLYDTVYAFQDLKDDEKIGVMSTARLLKGEKKSLYILIFPIAICLIVSGLNAQQSVLYYFGVTFAVYYLFMLLDNLNEKDTWSCGNFFRRNARVGVAMILAWFVGNLGWVIFMTLHTFIEENDEVIKKGIEPEPHQTLWQRFRPRETLSWKDLALMGITGGSEAYVRDVAQAQALRLGTHIDRLDRWLKPSFV